MNAKTKYAIISLILFFGIFGLAENSLAAVTLPWSTTYDCAEWQMCAGYPTGCSLTCDGLVPHGGWAASCGNYEQITTAANNPGGGGGRGERHWLNDPNNDNSGALRIDFTDVPEFWIRFYIRFQSGFAWYSVGYYKIIYVNPGHSPYCEIDWPWGWHGSEIVCNYLPQYGPTGTGWDEIMVNGSLVSGSADGLSHRASDGQWHSFEYHFKTDTNRANGIWQLWIDGVLKVDRSDVDYIGSLFGHVVMGSNHTPALNGGCAYVDYDDIAISTTGYIGPLSQTPDTTPPAPPTGLAVI